MLKKRRISDFGDSCFLVALGIFFFFYTRNPAVMSQDNTTVINGVLEGSPKFGVHDESQDYVGFKLIGKNDFYEFSGCSYSDYLSDRIKALNRGDSIVIRLNRNYSSVGYHWSGNKYKTYKIVAAYSPKHGNYISLERYNECLIEKSSMTYPIFSLILILIGFLQGARIFNLRQNFFDAKYLDLKNDQLKTEKYLKLHPNKLAFLLKKMPSSIFLVIVGSMQIGLFPGFSDGTSVGLMLIFIGFYIPLHFLLIHRRIYYIIDEEGVHFITVTPWLLAEVNTVRYGSIKEVRWSESRFEELMNVGTVLIYSGRQNSDGDREYDKIVGIKGFIGIEGYIKKMISEPKYGCQYRE